MRLKKILAIGLATIMALGTFTGCGSSGDGGSGAALTDNSGGAVHSLRKQAVGKL